MTDTSVASDFLKTLDVERDLSSHITFYCVIFVDYFCKSLYFIVSKFSDTGIRINICCLQNLASTYSTNSVDVS